MRNNWHHAVRMWWALLRSCDAKGGCAHFIESSILSPQFTTVKNGMMSLHCLCISIQFVAVVIWMLHHASVGTNHCTTVNVDLKNKRSSEFSCWHVTWNFHCLLQSRLLLLPAFSSVFFLSPFACLNCCYYRLNDIHGVAHPIFTKLIKCWRKFDFKWHWNWYDARQWSHKASDSRYQCNDRLLLIYLYSENMSPVSFNFIHFDMLLLT